MLVDAAIRLVDLLDLLDCAPAAHKSSKSPMLWEGPSDRTKHGEKTVVRITCLSANFLLPQYLAGTSSFGASFHALGFQSSAVYTFPGVRRQVVVSYRCEAARDNHPLELRHRQVLRLAFGGWVRELHV